MKCPVCGKIAPEVYRDTMEGGITMEYAYKCPHGHYEYFYATGTYEVMLGGRVVLVWSYDKGPSWLDWLYYVVILITARLAWVLFGV